MSVGICSLVYGEEHINEFNGLIKSINRNPIYAYTNMDGIIPQSNINIIKGELPFNFNLKRYPIEEALKHHNTIVCLDTDVVVGYEFEFDSLEGVGDGLYTIWMGSIQKYKNNKLSIHQILNKKSGLEEIDLYGDVLLNCGATTDNITFFDEYAFVLKISDEESKTEFIKEWELIDYTTRHNQPLDRHTETLKGALESLIISLACSKCGINIYSNNEVCAPLLDSIVHFDSTLKSKQSLI